LLDELLLIFMFLFGLAVIFTLLGIHGTSEKGRSSRMENVVWKITSFGIATVFWFVLGVAFPSFTSLAEFSDLSWMFIVVGVVTALGFSINIYVAWMEANKEPWQREEEEEQYV